MTNLSALYDKRDLLAVFSLPKLPISLLVRVSTSSIMSSPPHIEVTDPPKRFPSNGADGALPSHHLNDSKTLFGNPWPSFRWSMTSLFDPRSLWWLSPPDSNRPCNGSLYVTFYLPTTSDVSLFHAPSSSFWHTRCGALASQETSSP
jgi:hypothetical protein